MSQPLSRKEIRHLCRIDLDDVAKPHLWSDDFLNGAINRSEVEACRRGRLIVDSRESQVTRITLTEGENLYRLDPRVIFVRRVRYVRASDGYKRILHKIRGQDLDHQRGSSWEEEAGEITHFVMDRQTGFLVPYRLPTASSVGTLELTVVRTPMRSMESDDAKPEIAPRWHPALRHNVVMEAYLQPDEDKYRPDKAKIAAGLFAGEFGQPSTAQDETWINEHHGFDPGEGLY